MLRPRTGATLLLIGIACCASGCDTISSDFSSFTESFSPPTPQQAAQWAADPNDQENARRGTILLANAPWGGALPYLRMYRLYAEDSLDPLVRAAALQALGRHGDPEDAVLVAKSVTSPFRQVRLAAAKALQRLHDPAVADTIWPRLVDGSEDADVRVELAIALGQYATRDSFEALCSALDDRELAINLAAADSLRLITGADFGLEPGRWRAWRDATPDPFRDEVPYYFPTFERQLGFGDYIMFWAIPTFEQPGVPAGMRMPPEPAATPAAAPTPAPDAATPSAPPA
jgi:hypothetical protein